MFIPTYSHSMPDFARKKKSTLLLYPDTVYLNNLDQPMYSIHIAILLCCSCTQCTTTLSLHKFRAAPTPAPLKCAKLLSPRECSYIGAWLTALWVIYRYSMQNSVLQDSPNGLLLWGVWGGGWRRYSNFKNFAE